MGIQEYDFIAQMERLAAGLGLRGWLTMVALLILGVLFVGARISGWHELAKHYASYDRYEGRWISQLDDSGQEGGLEVSLRHSVSENAIKLGADSRGLYLQMSLPFRPFHPPLFIPWGDIKSVGIQELPWVNKKTRVRITFTQAPGIPLDVDWYVAGEIQQRANGRWKMPARD